MKQTEKRKRTVFSNPYLISYLGLAVFCCITLSVVFLSINLENLQRKEETYIQERLDLAAEDFERQRKICAKIALQISVNSIYQPYYFERNKYYEMTLLNDFQQYQNYSPVADELFLYFKGQEALFHSEGYKIGLDVYLDRYEEADRLELKRILENPSSPCYAASSGKSLFLFPIATMNSGLKPNAMLGLVVSSETVEARLRTVCGELNGAIAVYADGVLMYRNGEEEALSGPNRVMTAGDGTFRVCYAVGKTMFSSFLPLQILQILAMVLFVLALAAFFAYRSYQPLLYLVQKLKQNIPEGEEAQFASKLEEINYLMESMLKTNTETSQELKEKQEQLKKNLLLLVLNGKYSFDIQPYLQQMDLKLPGSWYFVIEIGFPTAPIPAKELVEQLQKFIDQLSDAQEQSYVYGIREPGQPVLSVVCSIDSQEKKEELITDISDLAESVARGTAIGVGNCYNTLANIPASYLEAVDQMHQEQEKLRKSAGEDARYENQGQSAAFHQTDFYLLHCALINGDEEAALAALSQYVELLHRGAPSFLMQQYQFTVFLSEFTKTAHELQIELSRQSVSLMLASRSIDQFAASAETMVSRFCRKVQEQKERLKDDETWQVMKYINENFSSYDLSMEGVAQACGVSPAFVRTAVQKHTGRSYKDYLIELRMEYAKKLLAEEGLTVAETCQRVGYSNISYFIKAFKAQNGVTPANYKNGKSVT